MKENFSFWLYKNPAFKMLFLLVIFIMVFINFQIDIRVIIAFSLINVLSVIYLSKSNYKTLAYFLIVINIALILSGRINHLVVDTPNKVIQDQPAQFKGRILKILKKNENSIKFIAKGQLDLKILQPVKSTNILINIYNSRKLLPEINSGNRVFANLKISFPEKKLLPNEFDQITYMKSNNIQWVGYASSDNFAITDNSKNIYYYRNIVFEKIKSIILNNFSYETAPIALAVITGDKSLISLGTREKYSFSGTAHLLAVSGLHTGLIALILFIILQPIKFKWIKFSIFLILISGFVILTGLQPSAVRAAMMVLLYLFLDNLERPASPVNIVSTVVLLNVFIDPSIIYSVGFQMSVLSIFGIIFTFHIFNKALRNIIKREFIFKNHLISSISLTLSATLITAPLVAYYFDVFSFQSVVSNLIVIPLFLCSMIFLIIGLIFSTFSLCLAQYYFISSDFIFRLIDQIITEFSKLEFLVLTDHNVLFYSIFTSIIILILFSARSLKDMIYRIVFAVLLFLIIKPANNKILLKDVYPRKYSTVLIEETKDSLLVIVIDRKPENYPKLDYGLFNFIIDQEKHVKLAYSGNCGIKLDDELKKQKNINSFSLSLESIIKLRKRLKLKEHLPQLIDYYEY